MSDKSNDSSLVNHSGDVKLIKVKLLPVSDNLYNCKLTCKVQGLRVNKSLMVFAELVMVSDNFDCLPKEILLRKEVKLSVFFKLSQ